MFKFLIDECLSPLLANAAQADGHEGIHVNWRSLGGKKDRAIAAYAIAEEWVIVTNNGADYRALYRAMDVHPGLVVIVPAVNRDDQLRLFRAVLARLGTERDLINKLIEIDLNATVTITDFPPFQDNI
jgi:predicted nuclease of predicted toxin-antitoxin system